MQAASAIFFNAEKRRLIEVLPDSAKKAWKEWEVELLILGSLICQIVVILSGKRRQWVARLWIRMVLWPSYLLADWFAIAALGAISQNTLDKCQRGNVDDKLKDELTSFWAPFMLLHLGGPDTITAYSLEDNELWSRHLGGLIIQSGLTFIIVLVSLPGSSWLPFLSLFIFTSGLIKFCERTCALRSANLENLRNSMLTPPDPGPNYAKFMDEFALKKAEGFYVKADEVKEITIPIDHSYKTGEDKLFLISEAFNQFQTFKRLFVDLILSFQDRDCSQSYFQNLTPKEAFDVIEAELGFAYDTFYTKAPVIYTPLGWGLRVVNFLCTSFSLISFSLCKERSKHHILDLILTYLLLVVALLLEIYAVFILLNSDWTKNWLSKAKQNRKFHQFLLKKLCLRRSNNMRWSNCTPQYNLLSYCVEFKPPRCYRFQKLFRIDELLEKHKYKKYEQVSEDLKKLIFNHFQKFAGESSNNPDPTVSFQKLFRIDELLEKLKDKKYEQVSEDLKKLIFNHFQKFAGESSNNPDPTVSFQKLFRINELLEKLKDKKYEQVSEDLKKLIFNHFQKFAGESSNNPDPTVSFQKLFRIDELLEKLKDKKYEQVSEDLKKLIFNHFQKFSGESSNNPDPTVRFQKLFRIDELLEKLKDKKYEQVSEDLKKLIFNHFQKFAGESSNNPDPTVRFQKLFRIDELLEKLKDKKYEQVSEDLEKLIFNHFQKFAGESSNNLSLVLCRGRGSIALNENDCSSLVWSTEVEFDQSILIWHIVTDLCYYWEDKDGRTSSIKESKQLSDYMMYLLVMCPFMLPIGIGMIRFTDTCAEAKEFFKERNLGKDLATVCNKLLTVNTEVEPAKVKGDRSKSVLFDACKLAKSLQIKRKQDRWKIITEVWVEMLAYAAAHCRGNHHAQQLRKGGELLTHVWLLMAHLGITEQFQIYRGHARAKLIVK